MSNINRDYLIKVDVKTSKVEAPAMHFYNTDVGTSNIYVQLTIKETLINVSPIENATDYRIQASIIKPNNVVKVLNGELVNEDSAIFEFDLPSDCTNISGTYQLEFDISCIVSERTEKITTFPASYEVKKSILTDFVPEITDTEDNTMMRDILTQLEGKFDDVRVNVEETSSPQVSLDFYSNDAKIKNLKFTGGASIDDTTTATNKTWSSYKIDSQIKEKANYNTVWNMSNMGQDVKEAMTGGSVAVVGKDSILSENIVDNQVTPQKTTFRKINKNKNQFNPQELIRNGFYNNGSFIESNTVYSTNKIYCNGYTKLFLNSYSFINFWGNDGFISSSVNADTNYNIGVIDIPQNAIYLRVSINTEVNNDFSRIFLILSTDYNETLNNIDNLKDLEYFDEGLVITDKNLKNIDYLKNSYFNKTKNRMILPKKMYFVDNETLPLYGTSILADGDYELILTNEKNKNVINKKFKDIELNPDVLNSTFKITINQGKQGKDISKIYYAIIERSSINSTSNNGKTKKWLTIGDSLTNRGVVSYTKDIINKYGVTLTGIGTMNNMGNNGEGREGWLYSTFIGRSSMSLIGEITPAIGQINNELSKNPFIRLATTEDKENNPDKCFRHTGQYIEKSYLEDTDKTGDFYIFDFANYLSVQQVDTPDIITIALGTNDIGGNLINPNINYINQTIEALNIMIDSIKSVSQDIKIGIVPPPVCAINDIKRWERNCILIEKIVQYGTDKNIDIIPTWISINRECNFPCDINDVQNLNKYEGIINDTVHFTQNGAFEYCKVMSNYIMNVI